MATLQELIESEICDFFAGFGSPGEPETPEDMQSQLLARIAPLLASMEQDPVYQACKEAGVWVDIDPASVISLRANGEQVRALYAVPQLPQPEVVSVPEGVLKSLLPDVEKSEFWFEHDGKIFFEGVKFNNAVFEACRAAMLQGTHRDLSHPVDPQVAEYEKIMHQAMPDGWVAVPVDPTEEMLDEFDSITDYGAEDSKDAWSRLIAAAPQQEAKLALAEGMARYGDAMQKLADNGD
ncbi:hypothetical protein G7090_16445 [Leclercia sp. 29361]|uniref:hypothetical protein n=1 Tax=Leclercia sp. 29361 TaxID=2714951 RepID=UPI00140C7AB8|nr:hypothetical protein [Leclercia sp. 29361]QIK11845.1 hypothetical protein G7090_16445 [Leclercia sp. 29361]